MSQITPESIFQVATGFMAAKHLFVANEVGLFEKLAGGSAGLDELAQRTGVHRRTLRIVADAMVALGFLEREGDRYRNGSVADRFLSGRTPADLRPFLRFWNDISYPRWSKLEDAVRANGPVHGDLEFTDEQQKIFSKGVEAITAGTAEALAVGYDFGRHRQVLDLGGGTGSFLIAVLRHQPRVSCTLFELPAVALIAKERLTAAGFGDRVRTVGGDCFSDPLPEGHDAVIVANVVHLLSPRRNVELLRRIRKASPDGARLLLVDFWTDPTHSEPAFAALMAGEFLLASGEGDVYSEQELREWLIQSGWKAVERKPLAGPSSLIVAETTPA